jgi:sulfate adenylyltransferase subunit 1
MVIRPRTAEHRDFRGYAGRVAAGGFSPGDPVTVLPSGRTTRIASVETADGPLERAEAGRSVVIRLADDVDVARGDLLAGPGAPPAVTRRVAGTVCWLAEEPLDPNRIYRVRQGTRDVRGRIRAVARLDLATLDQVPADTLELNDLGAVEVSVSEPLVLDRYRDCRQTGSFVVVDELSGASVAAGLVEGLG